MKILIIDDSLAIRNRIVKSLLTLPEVESILQCKRIPEAETIIAQSKPDVIITEFFLLTQEAIAVLRRAKQSCPALKLIILTDDTYGPFLQKCREAGADHVMHKLHEFEVLPTLISRSAPNRSPEQQRAKILAWSY